jgi:ABC-2 type transport system permease protein
MRHGSRVDKRTSLLQQAAPTRGRLHRSTSIVVKELRHIVRDGRTLFMVFISPAFTLVMLSYLFTWDVQHFDLGVLDQDRSSLSRQYVAALTEGGTVSVLADIADDQTADQLLLTDRVQAVVVIPPGLTDQVNGGESGAIQLILDGTAPGTASQMLAELQGRTEQFVATLSALPDDTQAMVSPIEIRTRVRYNANLSALHSMVPGLIAVVMCMPAFSIATALTREKELGTLEGLYATPVGATELLVGKLVAYLSCGLVSVLPVVAVATLWFGVPFEGNLPLFVVVTADFLFGVLGLSLLLASFMSSQQAATVVLFLVLFVPSMFLSGLIDPVDRTSLIAQIQANFLPTTHFVTISRAIFLKGVGLIAVWPSALILAGMGIVYLALTVKLFKKRLG